MTHAFLDTLITPAVSAAQEAQGVGGLWSGIEPDPPQDSFGSREAAFVAARDSFYMATISQSGWPYMQHRGGPRGFLKLLDDRTLGFADYVGNRQYLTLGNIAAEDRVCLFLMDYPARRRLKVLAHMTAHELAAEPRLAARLVSPDYRGRPERAFTLALHAFDWNCPQHITPRYTEAEFLQAMEGTDDAKRRSPPPSP